MNIELRPLKESEEEIFVRENKRRFSGEKTNEMSAFSVVVT